MNSTNGCCRMCGNTVSAFPKSHIIPRSFFSGLPQKCCVESIWRDGDRRLTRNALWEKGIVCVDCENRLARFDQYACLVFNQRRDSQLYRIDGPHGIIVFESVHRKLLRGFLATLLWRMSVSSLKEFEGVSIGGTYEERIASDVLSGGSFDYIDAVALHWASETNGYIELPHRKRYSGINGYSVKLPFLRFAISLDQRPHPFFRSLRHSAGTLGSPWSLASDSEGQPFFILDTPIGCTDIRALKKVLTLCNDNRPQFLAQKIRSIRGVRGPTL